MSTVEKLTIQGIRSFGPSATDCQKITFTSPVTLILGENGCGKTTIIECIKYALTGELPPATDRGKSFVYDPKIVDASETLGQIKAVVSNRRGAKLSVCRSMRVSMKRGKVSFETLDSTLNFLNGPSGDNTNTDSMSRRCNDADVTMCEFMGVSRAVINNVLFCHQEDSSWPLDEPKKLKEKFDAIFGITEFNKAMDKINKMRKAESDEYKVKESNLKLLAHIKKEMESKSLQLKNDVDKCASITIQCRKCEDEIKPIEERLQHITKIESDIGRYQAQKVAVETKSKNCKGQIDNLRKKIKKPFPGTLADLEEKIQRFDANIAKNQLQRKDIEQKLELLKRSAEALRSDLTNLEKKRCVALEQCRKEEELKKKRSAALKKLSEKLKMPTRNHSTHSTHDVQIFLEEIRNTILHDKQQITNFGAELEKEDRNRQLSIDDLRIEIAKCEESIDSLRQRKATHEKEFSTIEFKIRNVELCSRKLSEIVKQVEEADANYGNTRKNFDPHALREVISTGKAEITELQSKFKSIDEQITTLNAIGKVLTEKSLKEEELEKKAQEIVRIKSKHSENLKHVFGQPVTSNYRRALQAECEKLRQDITALNERSNAKKFKQKSCEIKRKELKEEIVRIEGELDESKEAIFQRCRTTRYEELLARTKETVSKYQLDHGALKSAEQMYKKYMQKLNADPCCPLCHKNMSKNEATVLSAELLEEIQKLPDNVMRAESILKQEQLKYEALLELKPIIEKASKLENELPKRREQLQKAQAGLSDAADEYENIQLLISEPTAHLQIANSMIGDMTLLDEALKDESRLRQELAALEKKIPKWQSDAVSIETLQKEKSEIENDLTQRRIALEKSQASYEENTEKLNRLQQKKNKLKEEQIKLQEGIQSLSQLEERKNEIRVLIKEINVEIAALKPKADQLKEKLQKISDEKEHIKRSNQQKLAQMQALFNDLKVADNELNRLHKEVIAYEEQYLQLEIEQYNVSIKDITQKVENSTENISHNYVKLDELKSECLNQESVKRDFQDNIELKNLEIAMIELEKELLSLNKELGHLDYRKLINERKDLMSKRDANSVRKGELLGQVGEINTRIKSLKSELEDKKYSEATKNYMRANFEMLISRRVIDDLGQYRLALEWALIQFHKQKMELINRLIREYWRLIYRGNDIDYVEIKTEEAPMDGNADRKRSYNYRVVQSKYNSELEMRGRCSAGQRVLASLIIRMALAETFSSNCSVLALDEPTTNLDHNNILSLCEALKRIIEERQMDSNFMLIVITHDERFISALGKIDTYYRVSRNDECKSIIQQVRVS